MAARRGPAGPSELATAVCSAMRKRGLDPDRAILRQVFTDLYNLSFETEEGNPIRVLVALGDRPEIEAQANLRAVDLPQHWLPWPLNPVLPLTTDNLAKLARATDPRSSAVAVTLTNANPEIWGLVDLQDQIQAGVTWEEPARPPTRPGQLQVEIAGVAHLVVWARYERLAELRGASLLVGSLDVFDGGPIREALAPGFESHVDAVAADLNVSPADLVDARPQLASLWYGEIRRLLLRLQSYRTGGTFIVTPDATYADLEVRHRISYDRLRAAMVRRSANAMRIRKMAWAGGIGKAALLREKEGLRREVDGANRFVSLLPRVDGAVVLSPSLEVAGFGVRIQKEALPPADDGYRIPVAGNRGGTARAMRSVDYGLYGTRHQSAFRYCQHVAGAVVLLVSHDGTARAITKLRGEVTLWSGIMLVRETRPHPGRPAATRRR